MPKRKYPEVKRGQKYGDWKVKKFSKRVGPAKYFECKCKCGLVKDVTEANLRSGASPYCEECRARKQAENRVKKNLGRHFGQLVVKVVFKKHKDDTEWMTWCDCEGCGKKDHLVSLHNLHSGTETCGCSRGRGDGKLPTPSKRTSRDISKRDKDIVKMKLRGYSLRDIAKKFNISKPRVHQLIKRLNLEEQNSIFNEVNKK